MFRTVVVGAVAVSLMIGLPAAAGPGADVYKAKCVMCHAPDGSGTTMGKKVGARPLGSAEVQKQSDAVLAAVIAKGKGKMPAYGSKLSAAEIQAVVGHIRTMKK